MGPEKIKDEKKAEQMLSELSREAKKKEKEEKKRAAQSKQQKLINKKKALKAEAIAKADERYRLNQIITLTKRLDELKAKQAFVEYQREAQAKLMQEKKEKENGQHTI